uniref:Uncharacterized protein n=1 Tax=Arundo donax TaxID=35708 RepID=A0A0A9EA99_ARUDO
MQICTTEVCMFCEPTEIYTRHLLCPFTTELLHVLLKSKNASLYSFPLWCCL